MTKRVLSGDLLIYTPALCKPYWKLSANTTSRGVYHHYIYQTIETFSTVIPEIRFNIEWFKK